MNALGTLKRPRIALTSQPTIVLPVPADPVMSNTGVTAASDDRELWDDAEILERRHRRRGTVVAEELEPADDVAAGAQRDLDREIPVHSWQGCLGHLAHRFRVAMCVELETAALVDLAHIFWRHRSRLIWH